jgi:hypothetical protein
MVKLTVRGFSRAKNNTTNTMKTPSERISVHHVKERASVQADLHLYCGRSTTPPGMINARMGNPFRMTEEKDREAVCDNYECWLFGVGPDDYARKAVHRIAELINEGKHIALYCHCAPKQCHCDSIRRFAIGIADQM